MGAVLAENKLHHAYWRVASKPTITTQQGGEASGFEFVNMFDNNAHTTFMNASATQSYICFSFPASVKVNGFAVYGHNLTTSQGIDIQFSNASSLPAVDGTWTSFEDSGSLYDGSYLPANNNGECFGAYFKGEQITLKHLRIQTTSWTTSTFMSNFALGNFVDNFDISPSYTMPSFQTHELTAKRNNQGNFLSSDTRKTPQKLTMRLTNLQESDLDSTQTDITLASINGLSATYSFIDYLGFFMSRFPFFVMHDDGTGESTDSAKISDRNKMYFCTIDKSLKQPQFTTPTTMNWSVSAIGYMS